MGLYLHAAGHRERGNWKIDHRTLNAWRKFAEENHFPQRHGRQTRTRRAAPLAGAVPARCGALRIYVWAYRPNPSFSRTARSISLLVKSVVEECRLNDEAVVLDLYCGAGNFSLPLALRAGRVLGVEENPYAVADADGLNREENGVGNAEFLHSGASRKLTKEEVVSKLGGQKARRRRARPAPKGRARRHAPGYGARARAGRLRLLQPGHPRARRPRTRHRAAIARRAAYVFDMFPHTAHLEILTSWTRKDASGPTQRF